MPGLRSKMQKLAGDAAYAAGYGYGKLRDAAREVSQNPDVQKAAGAARRAASNAAVKAADLTDHLAPKMRDAIDQAVPAIGRAAEAAGDAARHTVAPAVRDAATRAVPAAKKAVSSAARAAAPTVHQAEQAAASAVRKAGSTAAAIAGKVAVKNAEGMRDANARPHTVVDPVTGQKVTVQAYVRRPDGSRDYDAVYPRGTKSDFGPVGNKLVGTLLILAGVPMLVLPGPGTAAIAAGIYFWRKGDDEGRAARSSKPPTADEQAFHKGEDASDPRAAAGDPSHGRPC